MKKKVMLTIAAAAALFIANPNESLAHSEKAETVYKTHHQYVVTGSQFTQADLQKLIDKYKQKFEQSYQIEAPKQQPTTNQQPTQPAEQPKQTESQQDQSALSQYEAKVVELTNAERAKHGLAPLKIDEQLSEVARQKSVDMKQNNYFSHQSPTYGSPFDMMKQFGVDYRTAGENIARGQQSPEEVVNAWMNSDGHRKNILSNNFTHIGVGHVAEGNYWTQMFIGK